MPTWKRLLIAWSFVPVHRLLFRLSGGRLLGHLEGTGGPHRRHEGTQERQAALVALDVLPVRGVRRPHRRRFQLRPGPPFRMVLEPRRRPERLRRGQWGALRRRGPHSPGRGAFRAVRPGGCGEPTLRCLPLRYPPPDPRCRPPPRIVGDDDRPSPEIPPSLALPPAPVGNDAHHDEEQQQEEQPQAPRQTAVVRQRHDQDRRYRGCRGRRGCYGRCGYRILIPSCSKGRKATAIRVGPAASRRRSR